MTALEVVGPGNNFIGGGQSIGSCGSWGGPRDEFATKNKVRFSHNLLCNIAESLLSVSLLLLWSSSLLLLWSSSLLLLWSLSLLLLLFVTLPKVDFLSDPFSP